MTKPSLENLVLHARTRQLLGRVASDLPQSLVLSGPNGVGVATIAKALAAHVGSPELIIVPKKKSKDGTKLVEDMTSGVIVIDDIRELYTRTRAKSTSPAVYVLDFADRTMTVQAQNAFLKLLEEPRHNTHFILATHRASELLPTILSRSQRIDILPATKDQTLQLLDRLQVGDQTKRARLSFIAAGLPAELHRLAADETAYEAKATIALDAKTLLGGSSYDKLLIAHKYKDDRAGALQLLDYVNLQLRTIAKASDDAEALVAQIARHLDTRDKIAANGNVRLQLAADVV